MSKKSHLRGCFTKQYGKSAQTQLKSSSEHLYHIHWPLETKLCSRKSPLMTRQILGLLANTLDADDKYPALNRTITIQMILSEKKKFFLNFLLHFENLD